MRFLVDAQLPPSLTQFLRTFGEEAIACRDVGLRDADDEEIWRFAITGGWCIVTEDEDLHSFRWPPQPASLRPIGRS
jgi:predicted nuclease of predicted toxin-antitoxin system